MSTQGRGQAAGDSGTSGAVPAHTVEDRWLSRTKSFTRRSRALPESLERTYRAHAPRFVIEVPRDGGYTTISPDFVFDPAKAFPTEQPIVLEVGAGTGDQIVAAAIENPHLNYLALEVWQPGVAKIVSRAASSDIRNLRIIEADAVQALPILFSPGTISELWTFFPDPWRKARHRKRRLVNDQFARLAATILAPGAPWYLATDWDDYAWQMRDTIEASPYFTNPHTGENCDDNDPEPERGGFAPRFPGRVVTRFEQRGIDAGRNIHDLVAVRNHHPAPDQ